MMSLVALLALANAFEPKNWCDVPSNASWLDVGGWAAAHASLPPSECGIRIARAESWLLQPLNTWTEPYVIRFAGDRQRMFARAVTRPALLHRLGDLSVTLSSSNTHSYTKKQMYLSDYVADVRRESLKRQDQGKKATETFYLFGDTTKDWDALFSLFRPQLDDYEFALSFGIGADRSGVQLHVHGAVFAETIVGHKRWILAPPTRVGEEPDFDPNEKSFDYMSRGVFPTGSLDCTLGPGDVLFIPNMWWHATLNIGEVVFVSEFA